MSIEVVTPIKVERPTPAITFDVDLTPLVDTLRPIFRAQLSTGMARLAEVSGGLISGKYEQFTVVTGDELLAVYLRDSIIALVDCVKAAANYSAMREVSNRTRIALQNIVQLNGVSGAEPQPGLPPERGEAPATAAEEAPPEPSPDTCMCMACQLRRAIETNDRQAIKAILPGMLD